MTRLDSVKQYHALNLSNQEIADAVGVTTRTVTRLKRKAGIEPANLPPLTQEVRDEIRRLSEVEGWPPEEISDTLGISVGAAKLWGVRGPGAEWSATASKLAVKHRSLWSELRRKS